MAERLHKYMARCGVASRRESEAIILEGRVSVNGVTIHELGFQVKEGDLVEVDTMSISLPDLYYVLLNKPAGYITTLRDPQRRRTVAELLPNVGTPIKPVGRLDMATEGLLLATNDGELAARLTHPKYGIEKEYRAVVKGECTDKALDKLRSGIFVEGRRTAPAKVEMKGYDRRKGTSLIHLTLHEGRYHQVRLMCLAVGNPVVQLERVRYGFLLTKGVPRGTCRLLTHSEIQRIRALVGLKD